MSEEQPFIISAVGARRLIDDMTPRVADAQHALSAATTAAAQEAAATQLARFVTILDYLETLHASAAANEQLNDLDYQDYIVTSVARPSFGADPAYEITLDGGWKLSIPILPGREPRLGSHIRIWPKGLGFEIRGVAVSGKIVRYASRAEYEYSLRRRPSTSSVNNAPPSTPSA
jgi:hypothetical protein